MNDETKEQKKPTCTCTPGGPMCPDCVEEAREAGIPDRTLQWLELPKWKRIDTVMF